MTDEYVTDPELLKQLNEGVQTSSSEYVTDPELLKQLGTPEQPLQVETNPSAAQNIAEQNLATGALKAVPATADFAARLPSNIVDELLSLGKVGKKIGWEGAKILGNQWMETPIKTTADAAKAWAFGHATLGPALAPIEGKTIPGAMGVMGKGVLGLAGQSAVSPENAIMLPYNMAAYEQELTRQNPNIPRVATTPITGTEHVLDTRQYNPYAQVVRGEVGPQAPSTLVAREPVGTQAKAGEANRMKALTSMPFGNVTPQERQMLEEDMRMKSAIRKKAFEKVMGPVVPGSF